ncbi:MAG: hypothetical protein GX605_06020, partial [Chloroflexi bacterium]|nr:hypothetical protein [Chloroflexota bacterium]
MSIRTLRSAALLTLALVAAGCATNEQPAVTPAYARSTPPPAAVTDTPAAEAATPEAAATEAGTAPAPATPPPLPADAAALVNGQAVPLEAYEQQVSQFAAALQAQGLNLESDEGKEQMAQVRQQILEALIDQILIEQGAVKSGVSVADSQVASHVEASIAEGGGTERFAQWLEANGLTEQEYQAMVRSQLLTDAFIEHLAAGLPQAAPQVHLRQIIVADQQTASSAHERLTRGEPFDALAKSVSSDESTKNEGGDAGWFPKGLTLLPPNVEAAAFALQPGQVSDVLETPFGYYIIQVVEANANRDLDPEMIQSLRQQAL